MCKQEFMSKRKERKFCSKECVSKSFAFGFKPSKTLSRRQAELQKLICEPVAKGKDYKDYFKVV